MIYLFELFGLKWFLRFIAFKILKIPDPWATWPTRATSVIYMIKSTLLYQIQNI